MGRCSRLCCVKAAAVVTGLAATSLLTISVVILPWISISELHPTDILHKQGMERREVRSVISPTEHDDLNTGDESSGDVDDDLLMFGHVTTWPGPERELEVPSNIFLKPAAKHPHGIVPPTNKPSPSPSHRPLSTTSTRPRPTQSNLTLSTDVQRYKPTRPALNLPTDPPTRHPTRGLTYESSDTPPQGALLRSSLEVGLWRVCLSRSYVEWHTNSKHLIYTEVPNTSWGDDDKCWETNPFSPPIPPQDDVIFRVSNIIALLRDYHFNLSLAVSLLLLVVGVLVTSGGMARNNAIILAGAALYEFSALVLTIGLMWFYQSINYTWGTTTEFYVSYFGQTEIMFGDIHGPKSQIRHFYGVAFFVAITAFVMMNVAGAASIATYKVAANKTTPYTFIRKEREAVKKANKQCLVTRL